MHVLMVNCWAISLHNIVEASRLLLSQDEKSSEYIVFRIAGVLSTWKPTTDTANVVTNDKLFIPIKQVAPYANGAISKEQVGYNISSR